MLVNNLRLLGWKPERVKGLTGTSLTDFIPEDGADYVSAEALGMTDEVLVAVQRDRTYVPIERIYLDKQSFRLCWLTIGGHRS